MNRRKFVATAAVSSAGVGCGTQKTRWRVLSEEEARALAAIADQIIPPDQDPGASAAGAVTFIDRQLAGFYKRHLDAYRQGLRELDRLSGARFADLALDKQRSLLESIEKGHALSPFFAMLVAHTTQSFFGSPRHGGNKEYVSWRMLGVPVSPARGRL